MSFVLQSLMFILYFIL